MINPSAVAVIAVLACLPAWTAAQGGKPVESLPIFVDYMLPPDTLDGLAAKSDAVVVATVVRSKFRQEPSTNPPRPSLYTDVAVHISEVLKGHPQLPAAGSELNVERLGGEADDGVRIVRGFEPHFRKFNSGETYLLFLGVNPQTHNFRIPYGPDGAFQIVNGKLHALGHAKPAQAANGKAAASVLSSLRDSLSR